MLVWKKFCTKKLNLYGAAHLDDLCYLFDPKALNMKIDKGSKEYKLIHLVNTVFTNFANYGTPTPDKTLGITWPEYDNITKQYVDIGDELNIGAENLSDEIAFWKSVYEDVGVEF